MKCPTCGSYQVTVIDSRQITDEKRRRRYECYDCKDRFTTYEVSVGDAFSEEEIKEEARLRTIEEIMDMLVRKKVEK